MQAWLLLGLAFWGAPANAACSPVDLRPLLGSPLDQGDSSYCFAHSASTLIQARTGFRASPMALAVGYILTNVDELSGGSAEVRGKLTSEFIDGWRKDRNEPNDQDPNLILSSHGLIDTGGDEEPTVLVANFRGLCPESRLPTGKNVYKRYLKSIREFHAERMSHGAAPEGPIGEILGEEAQAKAWSYRHWVEKRCGAPVAPPQPLVADSMSLARNLKEFRLRQRLEVATSLRYSQGRVMDAVDQQLDRGNPVAIGYAIADIMPGEASVAEDVGPRPEDHASVLAARREVAGRCYYYLRNSFGQENSYTPALKSRFEDGGVWVLPEEIPSLYSAVWIR